LDRTVTDLASSHDQLRPLMFSIAYGMLGQVSEAEDIVQEAWLRMRGTDVVRSPEAFARTVTTRLAIDHLRSARARREAYVGSWLPEPLLTTGDESDPASGRKSPTPCRWLSWCCWRRCRQSSGRVFLLRDVFGYDFDEIAPIVDKSEQNCRQILVPDAAKNRRASSSRCDRELSKPGPTLHHPRAGPDGDLAALEGVLADDVAFYGDGGGKAPAVRRPVRGRTQVARFVLGLVRQAASLGVRLQPTEVNGQPGALSFDRKGRLVSVLSLDIADGQVWALRNVLNPDKLGHLAMLSPMPPD
jgi:DNA-directed RNA polymerase specialized sigma24 family protein